MIPKNLFHTAYGNNKTSVVIATKPHLTNLISTLNEKVKDPENKTFYFNPQNGSSFTSTSLSTSYYSPVLNDSKIKALKSLILLENPVEAGHV